MDPNRFVLLTEHGSARFGTKLRHFETAPFKEQVEVCPASCSRHSRAGACDRNPTPSDASRCRQRSLVA